MVYNLLIDDQKYTRLKIKSLKRLRRQKYSGFQKTRKHENKTNERSFTFRGFLKRDMGENF